MHSEVQLKTLHMFQKLAALAEADGDSERQRQHQDSIQQMCGTEMNEAAYEVH